MAEISYDKATASHVELERTLSREGLAKVDTMGTVKLTDGVVVYIPTPTADPQDPLNMPIWQKWVVMFIISVCEYVMEDSRAFVLTLFQSHALVSLSSPDLAVS